MTGLGFVASGLVGSGAIMQYLTPNVKTGPATRFKLLSLDNYLVNSVSFFEKGQIYVVRSSKGFQALSAVCTHLGCIVKYDENKQAYRCPCHGAEFSKEGLVIKGPPPRPLPWFFLEIGPDGRLIVDKENIVSQDFILEV